MSKTYSRRRKLVNGGRRTRKKPNKYKSSKSKTRIKRRIKRRGRNMSRRRSKSKNRSRGKMIRKKEDIAIVFDLDKTLGYFSQIAIFFKGIEQYIGRPLKIEEKFKIFDLYPEIFRPNIINVLKYLKKKKNSNSSIKVLIYTNNIGPKSWVYLIKEYLEKKIGGKIFDRVIAAWKVGKLVYEKCRTTHFKTVEELRKCGRLTGKSKIMFLDDQRHPNMINKDVTYLFLHQYHEDILFEKMISSFLNSQVGRVIRKKNKKDFKKFIMDFAQNDPLGYRYIEQDNDNSKMNNNYVMHSIKKFLKTNEIKSEADEAKKRAKDIYASYDEDNRLAAERDDRRLVGSVGISS